MASFSWRNVFCLPSFLSEKPPLSFDSLLHSVCMCVRKYLFICPESRLFRPIFNSLSSSWITLWENCWATNAFHFLSFLGSSFSSFTVIYPQCMKAWSVSSKWFSDHSGHFSLYSQHPSCQFFPTEIASLCWPLYWAIPPWQTELGSVHSACVSRLESVWQPRMCSLAVGSLQIFRAAKWRNTISSYVFYPLWK